MVRHQLAAELERVLADRLREFIHETFEIDGVLVVVHAAPEAGRDVSVAHRMINEQVRDRVAKNAFGSRRIEALEHERIHAVLQQLRKQVRHDRLAGNPHVQCSQVPLRVEPAGQLALRDRMVAAMRHVLFARPYQLDRRAGHLLGDQHRLLDKVMRRGPAAEPAAEMHPVDVAFGDRQSGRRRCDRECSLGILRWRPDLATVRSPHRRRVHRLHRRVVLERIIVYGFDLLGGGRECRLGVALLVADIRLVSVETFL